MDRKPNKKIIFACNKSFLEDYRRSLLSSSFPTSAETETNDDGDRNRSKNVK